MKKKICLLLCLLLFPFLVEASYPGYAVHQRKYEATIINENGAVDQNSSYTIPFKTERIVKYEYDDFLVFCLKDKDDACYNLNLSDVSAPLEETISPNYEYLKDKKTYYTYADTTVYSGPSKRYSIVGTIPKNNEVIVNVDSSYIDASGVDEQFGQDWGYVSFNNVSGWVYIMNTYPKQYDEPSTLATKLENNESLYIAYNNVKLYSNPSNYSETVDVSLKFKDEVTPIYTYEEYANYWYYVKYNDKYGWVNIYDVYKELNTKIFFHNNEVTLYGIDNKLSDTKLEKNSVCEVQGHMQVADNVDRILINCSGIYYYTTAYATEYVNFNVEGNNAFGPAIEKNVILNSDEEYFESPLINDNSIGTIEKGNYKAYIYEIEDPYDEVSYDNVIYIIGYGYLKNSDNIEIINTVEEETNDIETDSNSKVNNKDKIFKIIISCVSILITIIVLVIAIVMLKKNKVNEEE